MGGLYARGVSMGEFFADILVGNYVCYDLGTLVVFVYSAGEES